MDEAETHQRKTELLQVRRLLVIENTTIGGIDGQDELFFCRA
jgi:hypothetical protein